MSLLKSNTIKTAITLTVIGNKTVSKCNLCNHLYGKSAISRSDKWESHIRGIGCIPINKENQNRRQQIVNQLNVVNELMTNNNTDANHMKTINRPVLNPDVSMDANSDPSNIEVVI